jgi:hypothetical protein
LKSFFQFTKASKKRQTTLTLPTGNNTSSAQDMLKENKVSSPSNSSSSHASSNAQQSQQLSKIQTLSQGTKVLGTKIRTLGKVQAFAKKDVNVLTPTSTTKKKKVLCEASTGASTVAGLVNQIPRKKIKVSTGNSAFIKGEASSSNILNTSSSTQPENDLTKFFLSSSKTIDDDMIPCCSKNLSSFLKAPSSPSSTSSTSSGQMKITNFMPLTKKLTKRKIKFGKPVSRVGGKNLKKLIVSVDETTQSNTTLSIDSTSSTSQALASPSSKLLKKKKRSLKSERKKKSRSQKPLLH